MKVELGSGLITQLTCIFVVAKIWGKIDWSWWIVLSPLWISLILGVFVLIIVIIIMIIGAWKDWF